MREWSDAQLLQEYVLVKSDAAFRELVNRYTNLVYSAALRQVTSPEAARDVAQGVFCDLARKAASLAATSASHASLLGWLYRGTRFAALTWVRAERRRQARERQAMESLDPLPNPTTDWDRIQPALDEAMAHLRDEDREALLMRFFNSRDFRSIGEAMGISDDAAHKRVSRALERLRTEFDRRGITTTAAVLATTLGAHAVTAAPAGLAAALSQAALIGVPLTGAAGGVVGGVVSTSILQKVALPAILAIAVGTALYESRQASRLGTEVQKLQGERTSLHNSLARLTVQNQRLSNFVSEATDSRSLTPDQFRELMRLRGEVGMLRRQLQEHSAPDRGQPPGADRNTSAALAAREAVFQVRQVLDTPDEYSEILTNDRSDDRDNQLSVHKTPLLDWRSVQSAKVGRDLLTDALRIQVELTPAGRQLFGGITRSNLNRRLAFVLDGRCYCAPVIREEIGENSSGPLPIQGDFTESEATALVAKINATVGHP